MITIITDGSKGGPTGGRQKGTVLKLHLVEPVRVRAAWMRCQALSDG